MKGKTTSMPNSTQATLQHINLLERELQTVQQRRNEIATAAFRAAKQEEMSWKVRLESLDAEIKILKEKINRAHGDLGTNT
jgi:chromosome segregation ATPase